MAAVNIVKSSKGVEISGEVHQIPAHILHDGVAPVTAYFKPSTQPPVHGGTATSSRPLPNSASLSSKGDGETSSTGGPQDILENAAGISNDNYFVSFRGRELVGSSIVLPEGWSGMVMEKEAENTLEAEQQEQQGGEGSASHWSVTHQFYQYTCWGHDSARTADDPLVKSLDWLPISSAVSVL